MRTIRLTLEYDGTGYLGWQEQPQGPTIQSELERALRAMTGEAIRVTGAGRTDAGVHALGQAASFVTATTIPAPGLARGLTRLLPPDIAVVAAAEAPPGFDARRAARRKCYRYTVLNRDARSPLLARYAWHVRAPLDVEAMAAGARLLEGEHDLSAFRAADAHDRRGSRRRLDRLAVTRRGDLVEIEVEAPGFLKHMVRIVAGTLVEVGRGARPAASLAVPLSSGRREDAGPTAPAHGLCLVAVTYENGIVSGS